MRDRSGRRSARGVALAAVLLLAACGSSNDGGSGSVPPSATPTPSPAGLPTPSPAPTLTATQTALARGVRGAGHVAVASDGDGFLAAWIMEDDVGRPSIVARRLDADGRARDATPLTVALASDIDDGLPTMGPLSFYDLVAGFDGVSFLVTWSASRPLDPYGSEFLVYTRRVPRDGGAAFGLQQLFREDSVGFCNGATSGPLAATTLRMGMLLFTVDGYGCANLGPVAFPWLRVLTQDASSTGDIALDPGVGVSGVDAVRFLLSSTASAASRGSDALVRWLGVPPEDGGAVRNGLWVVDGTSARPIALGSTIDVATDGLDYLVLGSVPHGTTDTRELRASPFDIATLAVDEDAGVTVATGDHGATALAAFGPGRYVAAHQHETSVILTALTRDAGGATTALDILTLDGGEPGELRAASGSRTAVLLESRRETAESFTVQSVALGLR